MKTLSQSGFHWRADSHGRILYRVNEHKPTYVISRAELGLITRAAEFMAISLVVSLFFVFAMNGHWWLQGFRSVEFAALIAFVMIFPAMMIANLALVRHRVLRKARRSSVDIEITAATESLALAVRSFTGRIGAFWLWSANAVLLFLACEFAIETIRFLRAPAFGHAGSHQPGPLDGLFYMAFVLTLVFLVTDEIHRRRAERLARRRAPAAVDQPR